MWVEGSAIIGPPAAYLVISAANDGGGGFDATSLISTAVTPAIVVLLLLLGKLRTEAEVNRLEEDIIRRDDLYKEEIRRKDEQIKAKDDQLQTLQGGLVERAIPALTRSTLVLETLSPMLQTEVVVRAPKPRARGRADDS